MFLEEVEENEFDLFCEKYKDSPLKVNIFNGDCFLYDDNVKCVAKIEDDYICNKRRYYILNKKG